MNANRLVKILILWFLFMAIIITASQIYEIVSNDKILDNEIVDVSGSENEPYNSDDSLLNLYLQIYAKNENNEYVQKTSDNEFLPVIDNLRYTETINLSTGNWFLYYKFELSMQDYVSLNNNESCYLTINGRDVRNFFISGTGNTEKDTYEYNLTLKNSSDVAVNLFNVYSTISEYENKFFDFENQSIIGIKYQTSNYRSIERIAAGIIFNRDINDTYKKNTAIFCAILFKENRDATGQNPALTYQIEVKNNSIKFNNIEHESEYYKNIYSLESNEFYQTGSTDNGENLFISNSQKIVEEWGEGKELATLKCSIGEYYDEEGNLAISTKQNDLPMLFDIGDLVIPYIAVADGKTEPLSIKLDGTPKVFKVTQIRPYFDGAFWQEITLQEQTT